MVNCLYFYDSVIAIALILMSDLFFTILSVFFVYVGINRFP